MATTKLQYLLRAPASEPVREFRARVLDDLAPRLLEQGAAPLKVTLTAEEPPRLSVIPFRRERIALFSLWDAGDPAEAAARLTPRILSLGGGDWSGYRVEESLPIAYRRDWRDGVATPGAGMLTLLNRKPGLSDEEFFHRWHAGHSGLSLLVHPLWCYVRNVVLGAVVPGSPAFEGIVEEHFREQRDLLNPVRFFGGPLLMAVNMARVGLDILGWLDLATQENYLVVEQWVKS